MFPYYWMQCNSGADDIKVRAMVYSSMGRVMAESRKVLVEVELPSGLEIDERTLSKAVRLALIEILVARLGIVEEEAEWLEEEVKKRLRRELLKDQQ